MFNGQGSLSFYGPAESSLGVSGNWDNYSATVTGNVSITLTTAGSDAQRPGPPRRDVHDHHQLGHALRQRDKHIAELCRLGLHHRDQRYGQPWAGQRQRHRRRQRRSISTDGATLDGYTGSITVAAGGGGNRRSVTLNGNAANVLTVSAHPETLTTDQNTPVTFQANVNTSFADTYNLTAQRPAGLDRDHRQQRQCHGHARAGSARRHLPDPDHRPIDDQSEPGAQTTVNVAITPTQPGITFAVQPDPKFTVPFDGARCPRPSMPSSTTSAPPPIPTT